MKRTNLNILWGFLLIAGGLLALLQSFGYLPTGTAWEILWGIVFGIAGVTFLWWFFSDTTQKWWAAIPGMTLLGIAALIGLDRLGFADTENSPWLGGLFLAAIGLAFGLVYMVRREFWWAVIPCGALLTLAVIAGLTTWIDGEALGAVLFFGLAITFALVYLLPAPHGRMTWALIPAAVLAVMGLMIMLAFTAAINYVWALMLIAAGIFLLFRQRGGGEITRHG